MKSRPEQLRVIFMGTPEFAVASLSALVEAGFNVVAVVTAPDRPAGRGMKVNSSAVKQYALEKKLPVLQPEKLRDPAFLESLRALQADVQVVVAFRMLPEVVWNMPPHGTINVHASLLPKYRGAAPINWAIIRGEKETGVTTFRLQQEIDTGNILLQDAVPIGKEETAGELHDQLKDRGAALLVNTLQALLKGTLKELPQETLTAGTGRPENTHAPKIFTDTCRIDWSRGRQEIVNLVRGLSPYPGAFTLWQGKWFKILKAEIKELPDSVPSQTGKGAAAASFPDTVVTAGGSTAAGPTTEEPVFETDQKTFLRFRCADGYLYALEVQPEGKKRMAIAEFLRGFRG